MGLHKITVTPLSVRRTPLSDHLVIYTKTGFKLIEMTPRVSLAGGESSRFLEVSKQHDTNWCHSDTKLGVYQHINACALARKKFLVAIL